MEVVYKFTKRFASCGLGTLTIFFFNCENNRNFKKENNSLVSQNKIHWQIDTIKNDEPNDLNLYFIRIRSNDTSVLYDVQSSSENYCNPININNFQFFTKFDTIYIHFMNNLIPNSSIKYMKKKNIVFVARQNVNPKNNFIFDEVDKHKFDSICGMEYFKNIIAYGNEMFNNPHWREN